MKEQDFSAHITAPAVERAAVPRPSIKPDASLDVAALADEIVNMLLAAGLDLRFSLDDLEVPDVGTHDRTVRRLHTVADGLDLAICRLRNATLEWSRGERISEYRGASR